MVESYDLQTPVYQDLTFDIPTKYEYLTRITILIPTGRFFATTIDIDYWYHAFTYIPGPTLISTPDHYKST